MGAVVTALADCGYGWAYRVLDAQYFGVAQRRRRVFIVGYLGDPARAAEILFESEGGAGNSPESGEAGEDVAYVRSTRSGGARQQQADTYIVNGRQDPIASLDQAQTLDQLGHSQVVVTWDPRNVTSRMYTLDASSRHGVSNAYGVRKLTPLECERLQGFPDFWTCLCCAQSTQDCHCPDSPRYRAIGNAVCVPVAEWIARRVRAALEGHP